MPTITRVKLCTSLLLLIFVSRVHGDWQFDFSRRDAQTRSQDLREPASTSSSVEMPVEVPAQAPPPTLLGSLFQNNQVAEEIVVLNTEKGFVPSTIRVKKGYNYQIHVVNVNEKEKNVSFVLDSFSEHHATFYGKIKSFVIRPQKEGVYKFVSPETSAQGKLVVIPENRETRVPASEE
jgi:plastocyanin